MILNAIFVLPLFVLINGESNCTLYNLCGSHGYCYNDTDSQWFCECKFWWEGTTCNQQSDSGKQIILLGCLAGVLVFLFYGLKIGRLIYLKIKAPKKDKIHDLTEKPKLISSITNTVKRSIISISLVTTILVIIFATAALLIEWRLLRKIHREVVDQYKEHKDDPDAFIYYNRSSFCDILDLEEFNVFIFPFSCLIILLCIILTKRISLLRKLCYGYGAPPIPFDFFAHIDRKFTAVIFALIADELLGIVKDAVTGGQDRGSGILATFLLRVLKVLYMGVRYYPFLAAVYINSIFMLSCATLYAWLNFAFSIASEGLCYPDYYPSIYDAAYDPEDIIHKLNYYGTGTSLLAIEVCTDIPRYLCYAYVCVKLPIMLIEKIRFHRKTKYSSEEEIRKPLRQEEIRLLHIADPDSIEMLYVKNLFRRADQRISSQKLIARLIPKFIYEWRDDFQFSSRVLCIYSSVFFLLYYVVIWICVEILTYLDASQKDIQDSVDAIVNSFIDDEQNIQMSAFPIPKLIRPFFIAIALTVTIVVIQLIVLLANIRRNLIQTYRGDASEIPRRQRSQYVSYATGNFHFAGYFIGYFVWGIMILAFFWMVICTCIDAFVIFGNVRILEDILKAIIPSILLIIFKLFLNKLLAQYIFLQHWGDVLALNNRRFLMIFLYFNFFLDAFLGFISSIIRFVKSILATVLYMTRLDYSALGRKLETLDSGFSAYCGFIHTECTHRHPIMLLFVSILFNQIKEQEYMVHKINENDIEKQEDYSKQQKKSKRYIRKWRLAAFLVRNPAVVFFRKVYLARLDPQVRQMINDVDHNNEHSVYRAMAFYTRGMAAQQPNFVQDIDPRQSMVSRL